MRHSLAPRSFGSRVALAAVIALLAATGQDAFAAGGLEVAPSAVEANVQPGQRLGPIQLTNKSQQTLLVDAGVALAGESLSGLPVYDTLPAALAAGRTLLTITPGHVRLEPGATATFNGVVGAAPPRDVAGRYGVVLFTARAAEQSRSQKGVMLVPRLRLASNLLLRFTGHRQVVKGLVEATRVDSAPAGGLRAVARVRNTGNVDALFGGAIAVFDSAGRKRATIRFDPARVLPGAVRELIVGFGSRLEAGEYLARATVGRGAKQSTASTQFRLTGPGQLPAAKLSISSVKGELTDGKVQARIDLRNDGTADIAPTLELTVANRTGEQAAKRLDAGTVAAHASRRMTVELPNGRGIASQLIAEASDRGFVLASREAPIVPKPKIGIVSRFMDWGAGHLPLLAGLFLVLLVTVAGGLVFYILRLRRRVGAH
jgi:hypothetical protein